MKTKLLLTLALAMAFIYACNDSDDTVTHELPSEFPLEVGKAWVYERTEYSPDTSFLDTLYITGKVGEYYIYSWDPATYGSLVKNEDGALKQFGSIDAYDTIYYPDPSIWFIYDTLGTLTPPIYGVYQSDLDSINISTTLETFEGEEYHSYIMMNFFNDEHTYYTSKIQTYNKLGYFHTITEGQMELELKLIETFNTTIYLNKEFKNSPNRAIKYDKFGIPIN
ncbi:hypothetical protein [Salinivirga cyanobacteriivorans]